MLRMKKVERGFWLVRPDYLSFKATLNPRRLEFGPILQAQFTPRKYQEIALCSSFVNRTAFFH